MRTALLRRAGEHEAGCAGWGRRRRDRGTSADLGLVSDYTGYGSNTW